MEAFSTGHTKLTSGEGCTAIAFVDLIQEGPNKVLKQFPLAVFYSNSLNAVLSVRQNTQGEDVWGQVMEQLQGRVQNPINDIKIAIFLVKIRPDLYYP